MKKNKLTDLQDPDSDSDAATKQYVDVKDDFKAS